MFTREKEEGGVKGWCRLQMNLLLEMRSMSPFPAEKAMIIQAVLLRKVQRDGGGTTAGE